MSVTLQQIWDADPKVIAAILQVSPTRSTIAHNRIALARLYYTTGQLVVVDRVWVLFPNFITVMLSARKLQDGLVQLSTAFTRKRLEMFIVSMYSDAKGPVLNFRPTPPPEWVNQVDNATDTNIGRLLHRWMAKNLFDYEEYIFTRHPLSVCTRTSVVDPHVYTTETAHTVVATTWRTTLSRMAAIDQMIAGFNFNTGQSADIDILAQSAAEFPLVDQARYRNNVLGGPPIRLRQSWPVDIPGILDSLVKNDISKLVPIAQRYYIYSLWELALCLPEAYTVQFTPVIEALIARYGCEGIFVPVVEVPVDILTTHLSLLESVGGVNKTGIVELIRAYIRPVPREEVFRRLLSLPT